MFCVIAGASPGSSEKMGIAQRMNVAHRAVDPGRGDLEERDASRDSRSVRGAPG
jgi:hypothetical protein